MFFSTKPEVVLRDGTHQEFITQGHKEILAGFYNQTLKELTTVNGKYLRYKNSQLNVPEEALSRAPMFCNALASKGYKNILFVGHFNEGQTHWILDEFSSRMIDLMPPERDAMNSFPDMNIIAQYIPIVMKEYGYDINITIVRPPEDKYKGVMHDLYGANSLPNHTLACSQQYKHGQSSWSVEGEHEKFDAVVFLGVPMQDPEVGFEDDQVREIFAPMCTPEFDMVDIYYGAPSPVKWINGEEKDSKTMVDMSFALRSTWDTEMTAGRPEECDIMKNMIKIF
tara:strand:+ start:803 stop:1648 length:846 start_codon:yes stop_codon:yes gene_type:complete